jgi:ElaB/YqjD/DUF883 family membrane-anchored ribosome-binding protein
MATHDLPDEELEKIHAAISKLIDEMIERNEESRKLNAAPRTLNAEAGKFTREMFWYPMAVAIGLYAVIGTVMAVIFKLLH